MLGQLDSHLQNDKSHSLHQTISKWIKDFKKLQVVNENMNGLFYNQGMEIGFLIFKIQKQQKTDILSFQRKIKHHK